MHVRGANVQIACVYEGEFADTLALVRWALERGILIKVLEVSGDETGAEPTAAYQAAVALAQKKVGGLIVLQREVGLNEYMEIGTRLDARVSRELVESVFLPHSPIHDGALVIQKGRVAAVRCLLPLSTNPNLRKTWGTRHRAAIGVTEETDAVAVVISEQEGTIALVVGGNVTENIDGARLRVALRDLVRS